jgi:hypothetical protein
MFWAKAPWPDCPGAGMVERWRPVAKDRSIARRSGFHPVLSDQSAAGSDRSGVAPQFDGRNARLVAAALTFGPVLGVVACAGALWLLSGVSLRDIALFVGYETVFVLGPGWIVYGILRPRARTLERLAFGWGLGYVLEIGAFALTASLGIRSLFVGYPIVAGLLGLRQKKRARRTQMLRKDVADPLWMSALAGLVAVALVLVSAALFPAHPLPGTVPRVTYYLDIVFHISIAGEALHHWPLTDPVVSGQPLPYHTFVDLHMAAVTQVTGIDLPVVVFRLVLLPMVGLFILQAAAAGAQLGGRRWIGPLAAAILLLIGEFDLDPRFSPGKAPFDGLFFDGLWLSPSFLLGLLFFIPIIILLVELVAEVERPSTWRDWTLLACFMAGGAGAKVTIMPVVIGGLTLFLVVRRSFDRRGLGALLLSCVIFGASLLTMYRGSSTGLRFHFPATVGYAVQLVEDQLGWLPHPLLLTVAVIVGLIGLFGAPLCGLLWFVRARRERLRPSHALLLSIFVVSLVPYLVNQEVTLNQLFFTEYGFVAAGLVSAIGIYYFWTRSYTGVRNGSALVVLFAAAWLTTLIFVIRLSLLVVSSDKFLYLLWYGLVGCVLSVLAIATQRAAPPLRGLGVRLLLVGVLAAAALNVPLDLGQGLFDAWRGSRSFYDRGSGLTSGLYQGLEWLRHRTNPDDVIAVSNYSLDPNKPEFDDLYYSAFAERRVFLEGWLYSIKEQRLGDSIVTGPNMPYPERLRLNDAVFQRGDRNALRTLVRDYGVRYLLVDRVHGGHIERVAALGRLVFSDSDVAIYAVPSRASRS